MRLASWNEAYDHGRARGLDEEDAVAYADSLFLADVVELEPNSLTGVVTPEEAA